MSNPAATLPEASPVPDRKGKGVDLPRLVQLWWWCKARLWLWRWGRWLKRIHRMEASAALIEITRYKWLVAHAGYSEKWETVFLRALAISEESIRSKLNDPSAPAAGSSK